jgi:uncharacterized protein YyaL (SSP411 family)
MPNRLGQETSPYLLQHAGNPVDWYPWCEVAFSRALNEDKPILLSIGYSACHWCHVMAHESFENIEIANFLNNNFINIKVDREERPDLDNVYLQAVQSMSGSGGWPLTVFLTPEGKPFYGGTYFPPKDRHGIPGFIRVLKAVSDSYKSRRSEIEKAANQIITALTSKTGNSGEKEPLSMDIMDLAYSSLQREFDNEEGGFGSAPKFPQPMVLEFLLRYYHRSQEKRALEMVEITLEKMAKGGIYDHVGGGFHRYATDSSWLVPHFEKMLYDNALLSQVYSHAYLVTGSQLFRTVASQTIDYVIREMTAQDGAFYSTQDADTEGIEGKYYLWTPSEIIEAVGKDNSQIVMDYFGITTAGNFEGRNTLHVVQEFEPSTISIIEQAKGLLLERREQRVRPGRDEKSLATWNGLMLASLAEAACLFDRPDYLQAASSNGSFLLNSMLTNGLLKHSYKDGQVKINGYLEDYAMVINGFLALHQATFRGEWLRQAITLSRTMIEQFWDEDTGVLYDIGERHENLFVRSKSTFDSAIPSGASMATLVMLKLARLTDSNEFERIAERLLVSVRELMWKYPLGFGNWLCALDFYLSEPTEIVMVGPHEHPKTLELWHTLCATWLPNKVVVAHDPSDPTAVLELKLLDNRGMINNNPTVYICHHHSCQQPVTDSVSLSFQLRSN